MTEGAATVRYCIYTIMLCDECGAREWGIVVCKAGALGGTGGTVAAPIAYTLRCIYATRGLRMYGRSVAPIRALL
jgi:hypothetical protein